MNSNAILSLIIFVLFWVGVFTGFIWIFKTIFYLAVVIVPLLIILAILGYMFYDAGSQLKKNIPLSIIKFIAAVFFVLLLVGFYQCFTPLNQFYHTYVFHRPVKVEPPSAYQKQLINERKIEDSIFSAEPIWNKGWKLTFKDGRKVLVKDKAEYIRRQAAKMP